MPRQTDAFGQRYRKGSLPVGVQDGPAGRLASDGFVPNGVLVEILSFLEGGVEARDGDNGAGCLETGGGPGVPGEADAVLVFDLVKVHFGGLEIGGGEREARTSGGEIN